MRSKAAVFTFIMAVSVSTAGVQAQRPPRRPSPTQETCVRFVQQSGEDGHSITFELTNICNVPVESSVSWRVACDGTREGAPAIRATSLGPLERRVLVADASSCGERAWRIDGVHWSWSQHASSGP